MTIVAIAVSAELTLAFVDGLAEQVAYQLSVFQVASQIKMILGGAFFDGRTRGKF